MCGVRGMRGVLGERKGGEVRGKRRWRAVRNRGGWWIWNDDFDEFLGMHWLERVVGLLRIPGLDGQGGGFVFCICVHV